MIFFPNCKINIGLRVLSKRGDGYHNIETVMFPVAGLCDALEIVRSDTDGAEFTHSGADMACDPHDNLCVRAYDAVRREYGIGGVKIHLHKVIPMGAGLGGGSADAAFVVKGLSEVFGLGLDADIMERLAARTGSDTAFFINNRASVSTGRGEVLSPVELPLSGKRLVIVKPEVSVSTAMAYAGVVPRERDVPLAELLARPVERWRESVSNDFEDSVFRAFPVIGAIKRKLYGQGALYASMSGSGSAVFGIFDPDSEYTPSFDDMFVYQEDIL